MAAITRRFHPRGVDRLLRKIHPPNCRQGIRATITTDDGLRYAVDSANFPEWRVLFYGAWEPRTRDVIRQHISRGGKAVDIGANVGLHTLAMADESRTGCVIAVEPNHATAQRVSPNASLNGLGNVTVREIAVSDHDGEIFLYLPPQDRLKDQAYASQSVHAANEEFLAGLEPTPVPCITLDSLVDEEKLDSLDLVKIDVEGFDAAVIRGAKRTLRRMRPAVIFEFDRDYWSANGFRLDDTIAELRAAGYSSFQAITENGLRVLDVSSAVSVNVLAT